MVELYRFAVVGIVGAAIWAYALGWGIRRLFRRLLKRPARPRRPAGVGTVLHRGILLLAVLSVAGIAWGFAEPYFPRVERIRIESDKVTGPVRIVQLSDLHCDPKVRAEERLVRIVADLKPDLIVFTGDGVNSNAGIPVFRRTMRALSKIAPLYGVRGNWEAWWFTHVNTFKGTGMIELNGPPRTITVAGQKITLAGSAVDEEHRLRRALKQMPKKNFRLALHHFPAAERLVDGRADLLLTGDTHGGQIRLPLIGPPPSSAFVGGTPRSILPVSTPPAAAPPSTFIGVSAWRDTTSPASAFSSPRKSPCSKWCRKQTQKEDERSRRFEFSSAIIG